MAGFKVIEGDQSTHAYTISSTNSAIGEGDMIAMLDTGFVDRAAAGSTTIIGIAAHAVAVNTGGSLLVYDNPNIVFQGSVNNANFNAQTDFGLVYDLVDAAPTNGRSNQLIDVTTQATTATLPIKPLRLSTQVSKPANALGASVLLDCQFNQHFLKAGSVGI